MPDAQIALVAVGVILFVIDALWRPTPPPRVYLQSLGLAFFAAGHLPL